MSIIELKVDDITKRLGGNHFIQKRVFVRGGGNSIFSRLLSYSLPILKSAIPYIKKAGKYIAKRGLEGIGAIAENYSQGDNFKESVKKGIKRAGDKTKEDLKKILGGSKKLKRLQNRKF